MLPVTTLLVGMSARTSTITIDRELHKRIKISADLEDKTINEYLSKVLDKIVIKLPN